MNIKIRKEEINDRYITESLTRDAFWDLHEPGASEHLVLHNLRNSPAYIPELNLVAEMDGEIVGHIIYARAKVKGKEREYEVLTFGPVSVLPSLQKRGIGAELIRYSMDVARDMGFNAIIIYGHPEYYPRFGFVNAEKFGITTADGMNFDPFMAVELYPGALDGITGAFYEGEAYHTDKKELEEFEKRFPPRKKHITPTQLKH